MARLASFYGLDSSEKGHPQCVFYNQFGDIEVLKPGGTVVGVSKDEMVRGRANSNMVEVLNKAEVQVQEQVQEQNARGGDIRRTLGPMAAATVRRAVAIYDALSGGAEDIARMVGGGFKKDKDEGKGGGKRGGKGI